MRPSHNDLKRVSQECPQILRPGEHPIVVINYGVKDAILSELYKLNFPLITVPYNTSAQDILAFVLPWFSNQWAGDPRTIRTNQGCCRTFKAATRFAEFAWPSTHYARSRREDY